MDDSMQWWSSSKWYERVSGLFLTKLNFRQISNLAVKIQNFNSERKFWLFGGKFWLLEEKSNLERNSKIQNFLTFGGQHSIERIFEREGKFLVWKLWGGCSLIYRRKSSSGLPFLLPQDLWCMLIFYFHRFLRFLWFRNLLQSYSHKNQLPNIKLTNC